MSGSAQVRSTDAIEAFRQALIRFQDEAVRAVEALDMELQRAEEWIDNDRPAYWKAQLQMAEQGAHDAKMELARCLMMTTAGERPTCREQRAAVRDWLARVDRCREKLERVRHWQRNFSHESLEHKGRIGQLRRLLEIDVPDARGSLESILRRLDAYQIERPPDLQTREANQTGDGAAEHTRDANTQSGAASVVEAEKADSTRLQESER